MQTIGTGWRAFQIDNCAAPTTDLAPIPISGYTSSYANDVNIHRDVVGDLSGPGRLSRAFYAYGGQMLDLAMPASYGFSFSTASAINDTDRSIVGTTGAGSYIRWPTVWRRRQQSYVGFNPREVHTGLPGVHGTVEVPVLSMAFEYEPLLLPKLSGASGGYAYDINNPGWIVGLMQFYAGGARAFLSDGAKTYDLNDLVLNLSGWVLYRANAINDRMEIAGIGRFGGRDRAFKLVPR